MFVCVYTPRTQLRQGFQAGRRLQELEAKMAEDKELADEYDRREAVGHATRYCKRIRVLRYCTVTSNSFRAKVAVAMAARWEDG